MKKTIGKIFTVTIIMLAITNVVYASNINKKDFRNYKINTTVANSEEIESYILEAAEKYDVRPELIESIIKHESTYNQNVTSWVGAIGLMQLMPLTAQELNVNPYDAKQNIEGGTKYIKQLLDMYSGNIDLVLASYNAGSGNVNKYNGIPPFKETQNYVKNVKTYYELLIHEKPIKREQNNNARKKLNYKNITEEDFDNYLKNQVFKIIK